MHEGWVFWQLNPVLCHRYSAQMFIPHCRIHWHQFFKSLSVIVVLLIEANLFPPVRLLLFLFVCGHLVTCWCWVDWCSLLRSSIYIGIAFMESTSNMLGREGFDYWRGSCWMSQFRGFWESHWHFWLVIDHDLKRSTEQGSTVPLAACRRSLLFVSIMISPINVPSAVVYTIKGASRHGAIFFVFATAHVGVFDFNTIWCCLSWYRLPSVRSFCLQNVRSLRLHGHLSARIVEYLSLFIWLPSR